MRKVRIVGVGSPFASDRLGWEAVDYLAQQIESLYPGVLQGVDRLDRPGPLLLEYLRPGEGLILLLDAVAQEPGLNVVASYTLEELGIRQGVSSHGFGVAETLALGESLGLLHRDIVVLGIASDAEAWQEPLLAEVNAILSGSI